MPKINTTLKYLVSLAEDSKVPSIAYKEINDKAIERNRILYDCIGDVIDTNNSFTLYDVKHVHGGRALGVALIHLGNECHIVQPFYRSSGHNSGMPGTWLPFNGFNIITTETTVYNPVFYTSWLRKYIVEENGTESEQDEYDRFNGKPTLAFISKRFSACMPNTDVD